MKLFFLISFFFIFSSDVSSKDHKDTSEIIKNSIENKFRNKENIARDKYRNPQQTLEFFGLKKNMSVLEILPGKGWYTEILSNVLKVDGKLFAASFGENHPNEYLRKIHLNFMKYFSNNDNFGNFEVVDFFNKNYLVDIDNESLDMVLTFRNSHNWLKNKRASQIYKSFNRVLKNEGILGVVQHRSDNNLIKTRGENGYVDEQFLSNLIESCGFKLVASSEINQNSLDTKNYSKGVWALPPTFRDGKKDVYKNIGESDRMTLKFKKIKNASFADCHTY